MDKWEYIEDSLNLNEPHLPARKIIQMREQAGYINTGVIIQKNVATLKFKRKIQQQNGNKA